VRLGTDEAFESRPTRKPQARLRRARFCTGAVADHLGGCRGYDPPLSCARRLGGRVLGRCAIGAGGGCARDRAGKGDKCRSLKRDTVSADNAVLVARVKALHAAFNRRDLDSLLFTPPEPSWTGTSPRILC
jgi:hypothetical protein